MTQRYWALRAIALYYKIYASCVGLVGVLFALHVLGRGDVDRFWMAVGILLVTAFCVISIVASAEGILVVLDIEENTRAARPDAPPGAVPAGPLPLLGSHCPRCGQVQGIPGTSCAFCGFSPP